MKMSKELINLWSSVNVKYVNYSTFTDNTYNQEFCFRSLQQSKFDWVGVSTKLKVINYLLPRINQMIIGHRSTSAN